MPIINGINELSVECEACSDEAVHAHCEKHFEEIKQEAYDAGYNAGKRSDEPSQDEK